MCKGLSVIIDLLHETRKFRLWVGGSRSFVLKNVDNATIDPFLLSSQYIFFIQGLGGRGLVGTKVFHAVKIIDNREVKMHVISDVT